ncbi:MAG: type I restriction enzyme HsdR N-terminal domain-containing protein, partial [Chitinispirillales bacterium]|nr:type I restriction enzyme HsdR N-terminal domain-containing protein [Chitinispirillales bacterium]
MVTYRESEMADKFVEYLIKDQGYPKESIAVEYDVGKNNYVDIAILDLKTRTPIQLFELKGKKTKETEERGKKQLKKYRSLTDNQSIPAYLIFLNDNEPYF